VLRTVNRQSTICRKYSELPTNSTLADLVTASGQVCWPSAGRFVTAYGQDLGSVPLSVQGEQSIGWYYYLEEHLRFPFRARCKAERPTSPLRVGDVVDVRGKLGLRSRAQVAAWAVEHALYTP
jgi:Calcium binding